jgi:xanthine/CO dehydrogenase XdhC/CoxF family maturation factor
MSSPPPGAAQHDPACAMAHGDLPPDPTARTLVAVFAGPVAQALLHFGRDVGYRTVLLEPDPARAADGAYAAHELATAVPDGVEYADADAVVVDHDRPELGEVLRDVLEAEPRWVGVMGSPRHTAPHLAALRALGVAEETIARVHRPVGLNIGSKTPPEIAVSVVAGLIADRNGRPGGASPIG